MLNFALVYAFLAAVLLLECNARSREVTHNNPTELKRWQQEIDASLKRNIRGTCRVRMIDQRNLISANRTGEFLVHRMYPARWELDRFRQLPQSLTQSDSNILFYGQKNGYSYEEWLKIPVPRWEIPSNHIGQNHTFCLEMMDLAGTGKVTSFYESFRSVHRAFYVVQAHQAVIHPSGSVWTSCGYFMGQENCETRWDYAKQWHGKCLENISLAKRKWTDFWNATMSADERQKMIDGCTDTTDLGVISYEQKPLVSYHDKVFIISALWDYNYHHWLADSLPRLMRHLAFLRANPSIKIHIRHFEDYDNAHRHPSEEAFRARANLMRYRFFDLLGLDRGRFVSGLVIANEAFLARNMRCAWALSNPLETRLLARHLHAASKEFVNNADNAALTEAWGVSVGDTAANHTTSGAVHPQKTVIVLQRLKGDIQRAWSQELFDEVIQAFQEKFPSHRVLALSESRSSSENYCLACDIALFAQADVLVGEHGAGLTNMMFMPRSSLVVELVGAMKDVNMPICGYYGTYGAIFGHHHYLHVYDTNNKTTMFPHRAAERAASLYIKIHSSRSEREADVMHVLRTPVEP